MNAGRSPSRPRWGPGWVRGAAVWAALSVALWPFPLVGLLHAESAAVVATAAFFGGGVAAVGALRRGVRVRQVLGVQTALLGVPFALLTLSLLWRPNCGWPLGAALYPVFTVPSVALAVGLASAFVRAGVPRPGLALVGTGLVVALAGPVYDLALHPQLFTYNHVFGGVLGPIYDEELAVRPGLFAFRALTLGWALALWTAGRWVLARRSGRGAEARRLGLVLGALALGLGGGYALSVPLGFNTSMEHLSGALGGERRAGPFVIHYSPEHVSPERLEEIVEEHLFRYAVLRARLGIAPEGPIHTFLYADLATRGQLIGARETSVAPVWLRPAQMHLLETAFDGSFGHELAHVFSREFGHPLTGATWAVGLVEGLAVALEPPDGLPPPADQVAAGLALDAEASGGLSGGLAPALVGAMSPWGFWTGRAGVNYTTSGAFVSDLLDRYGPEPLMAAYRAGSFEPYGRPLQTLAEEWEARVRGRPVSPEALALAEWRFSRPSLLEVRCPHHVAPHVRLTRRAAEAAKEGRRVEALALYDRALARRPGYGPALGAQARLALAGGLEPSERVAARLAEALAADTALAPTLGLVYADALRLAGQDAQASEAFARALAALPPYARGALALARLRAGLSAEVLALLQDPDARPEALVRRAQALEALAPPSPDVRPEASAQAVSGVAVFAALAWAEAERPAEAWALARRWPPPSALLPEASPEVRAEVGRFLRARQAALAYRAGNLAEADRLAREAEGRYRAARAEGPAEALRDLRTRIAWRQGGEGQAQAWRRTPLPARLLPEASR